MALSNSLLSLTVIAVIVVVVSGYLISYSVGMDTVADILFTGILDAAYAAHGGGDIILNLTGAWQVPDLPLQAPGYAFAQTQDDDTPPTFVSSEFDPLTGVLNITFSEPIDVTPKTNVDTLKIHIRESGNYTGDVTLTAGELGTAEDGDTIFFTLTSSHRAAVAGLAHAGTDDRPRRGARRVREPHRQHV